MSVVVEAYHGTISDFRRFDASDKKYLDTKNPLGDNIGAFFSVKKSVALDFANRGSSDKKKVSWQLKYINGSTIGGKMVDEQEAIDTLRDMGTDRFELVEVESRVPAKEFDSIVIKAQITLSNPMRFDTYDQFKDYIKNNERIDIESNGFDGVVIEDSNYDNDKWIISFYDEQIKELSREVFAANGKINIELSSTAKEDFVKSKLKMNKEDSCSL